MRARRPAGGGVIKAQEPWSNRNGKFVSNVKLGKELFLELVRVPFQLCAARIRVVVLENELASNQAQLQRITRRWRRRGVLVLVSRLAALVDRVAELSRRRAAGATVPTEWWGAVRLHRTIISISAVRSLQLARTS